MDCYFTFGPRVSHPDYCCTHLMGFLPTVSSLNQLFTHSQSGFPNTPTSSCHYLLIINTDSYCCQDKVLNFLAQVALVIWSFSLSRSLSFSLSFHRGVTEMAAPKLSALLLQTELLLVGGCSARGCFFKPPSPPLASHLPRAVHLSSCPWVRAVAM